MKYGNRTTDNALVADEGKDIIPRAFSYIESKTDWHITDRDKFKNATGIYYDSKKIGSVFVEVTDQNETKGVLKIQLRPLTFDEGSIIRHVSPQIKSKRIRLPKIFLDNPWNEKDGYGFIIFEDLSYLPKIWSALPPKAEQDYIQHKDFLKEFIHNVLPIKSFVEKPTESQLELAKESFDHYRDIAQKSSHKHFVAEEIGEFKKRYFEIISPFEFEEMHFTHGHLSGLDVVYDAQKDQYGIMGNLYWKWRPKYWELTFPTWNSLMHIRDKNLTFEIFLARVNRWVKLGVTELYDYDPSTKKQYWVNLLSFTMNTIMLDLGASEWKENETEEKQTLLNCWKEFFSWIIENRLTK